MTNFRIALANIAIARTPEESVRLAANAVEEAGGRGARILCFPECYVPGYRWPGTHSSEPDKAFLEGAWATVAAAACQSGIAVVLGTERPTARGLLISALVINADGPRPVDQCAGHQCRRHGRGMAGQRANRSFGREHIRCGGRPKRVPGRTS